MSNLVFARIGRWCRVRVAIKLVSYSVTTVNEVHISLKSVVVLSDYVGRLGSLFSYDHVKPDSLSLDYSLFLANVGRGGPSMDESIFIGVDAMRLVKT